MTNWEKEENKQRFVGAVAESKTIAGVLRCLGLRPTGGNYKTVKYYIAKFELDISHHVGQSWRNGYRIEKSSYRTNQALRKRLIEEYGYFCTVCGLHEWNRKPLTLEMDHINGINNDNRFENVRLLCPNCHSQTDTFRSKNRKGA